MLVIKWDHEDFRIKISDIGQNVDELTMFFESKIENIKISVPGAAKQPSERRSTHPHRFPRDHHREE